MDAVTTAERIATAAHAGQVDKAGRPYIDHPRRVASLVSEMTDDPDAVAAAWLHDVVEDTGVTLDHLRTAGFSTRVLDAVDALTRRPDEGDAYYQRVRANGIALIVKRADIVDNTDPYRVAMLPGAIAQRMREKYIQAMELLACPGAQPLGPPQ